MDEEPLAGGIANEGTVVRAGAHVLRPATPWSASVHAFLRAVRAAGFEGVPAPVAIEEDERGWRERLALVPGDVPVPPYPAWSQTTAALASVARLLRGLHDASRTFDPGDLPWAPDLADPAGGPVVVHNDVELSNVVFRDGAAVSFIDFELAAPGRPVYDLAHLARLCVPFDDEVDRARVGWAPADPAERLRVVADAYGLDRDGRGALLAAVPDALDRIEAVGRQQPPGILARTGGLAKYDRRRRWWAAHRDSLVQALA